MSNSTDFRPEPGTQWLKISTGGSWDGLPKAVRSSISSSAAGIILLGMLGISLGGWLWWALLFYPWRLWKKGAIDNNLIEICEKGLRIRANDQSTRYVRWAFLESPWGHPYWEPRWWGTRWGFQG